MESDCKNNDLETNASVLETILPVFSYSAVFPIFAPNKLNHYAEKEEN